MRRLVIYPSILPLYVNVKRGKRCGKKVTLLPNRARIAPGLIQSLELVLAVGGLICH
jgi:hypothetical protein